MSMSYDDFTGEINDSLRAHYVTGHFDLETTITRTQHGGLVDLTREQAVKLLQQPITPYRVKVLTGKDVTEGLITAKLAEVNA